MRSAEIILRNGGGEIKEYDGRNEFKIYCEHFCKHHNVPQYNNNIIKNKIKINGKVV
jgi:hypothetical protein